MKLDDINDALETELNSEDYDSIGGLMIEQLERLPKIRKSSNSKMVSHFRHKVSIKTVF